MKKLFKWLLIILFSLIIFIAWAFKDSPYRCSKWIETYPLMNALMHTHTDWCGIKKAEKDLQSWVDEDTEDEMMNYQP
jgi:hypothetical protein